jgi:hypothetical protein
MLSSKRINTDYYKAAFNNKKTYSNAWIDLLTHLYTPLGTTRNYSATANLHNSQIITAHAKLLQPAMSLAVP